jgi:predicted DNA-binding protein (UPF0251 family)
MSIPLLTYLEYSYTMRMHPQLGAKESVRQMTKPELIPLNEAAKRLGVSKMTMARLVKQGSFTIFENPLDRRQKLVDAGEVAAAVQPRRIEALRKETA